MCILFFALKQHPKYPVIICANRDEFHQRPTKAMHFWQTPEILAGKDLTAGGSWLGLSPEGRFSAITNFRQLGEFDPDKKSRGELVIQALTKTDQAMNQLLTEDSDKYNGFNLVYGQLDNLHYFDSVNKQCRQIPSGVHSLCNGALDDIWPKMALGQQQLSALIHQQSNGDQEINQELNQELNIDKLFDLMKNAQQAKTDQLPNTGITTEWELFLSSIFIVSPEYGTRTTSIIMQNNEGDIFIEDRSYNALGQCTLQQNFKLIPTGEK